MVSKAPEELLKQVLVTVFHSPEAGRAYIWGLENQEAERICPGSWSKEKFCASWHPFRDGDTCPPLSEFNCLRHPDGQDRIWVGKEMAVKERNKKVKHIKKINSK